MIGGLFAATPAYAAGHSWNPVFGSQSKCKIETAKKVKSIAQQRPTSYKVRYICKHVQGYYGTSIDWRTR